MRSCRSVNVVRGPAETARAHRVVVAVVLVVSLSPSSARAYRTLADDLSLGLVNQPVLAVPVAWDLNAGVIDSSERAGLEAAAVAAFDAWEAPVCSGFRADYRGLTSAPAVASDGRTTITVVTSGWLARGLPDGRGATTDVQIERDDTGTGRIVAADIYLNFDQHRFALTGVAEPGSLDLTGVLTHEVGHLLGLLHPCEHDRLDVPTCDVSYESSALYPDYRGAIQRVPDADDVAGLCALYPSDGCAPACPALSQCIERMCVDTCSGAGCAPMASCDGGCPSSPSCSTSADCAFGTCAFFGVATGQCVPAGSTGTTCGSGADCASGLCLTSTRLARSICTRACTEDPDCGSGERCVTVDTDQVCAPAQAPPSGGCVIASADRDNGRPSWFGTLCTAAVVLAVRFRKRGTRMTQVRHARIAVASFLVLVVSTMGCGNGAQIEADANSDAATEADSALGVDAGMARDIGSPMLDTGTYDSGATDADEPSADAAPPDDDGDGVASDEDCDDSNASVGRTGSRSCAGLCGAGAEDCIEGVWGACSAPTDCACAVEGMTRGVSCGMCGTRRQTCTAAIWVDSSTCMTEGACLPGSTETRATEFCITQTRTCSASCAWGAFLDDGPSGECRAGEMEDCAPPFSFGRTCGADCLWGPPTCS